MGVALLGIITATAGNITYRRIHTQKIALRESPHSRLAFPTFPPTIAITSSLSSDSSLELSPTLYPSVSVGQTVRVTATVPTLVRGYSTAVPTSSSSIPSSSTTQPPATTFPVSPSSVSTTTPQSATSPKWGAYVSWEPSKVLEFQTSSGKKMDHIATFVHWGNESNLPTDLGNITKNNGQNLILFWEAMDYNVDSPNDARFNYDAILNGNWDTYLKSFAQQIKDFGGNVVLIPFEEMNGDWYTWSLNKNGNSESKHVSAYRYVRKFFDGIPNVKFAWVVNNESAPGINSNIKDYYPGDQYVDLIGVNGFNFGEPWVNFSQIFDSPLSVLETIGKPIMIFSTASAPGPQKAAWIKDFGEQIKKHPKVVGWNWFNENKEKDWRVNSDNESFSAFKSILP